MSRRGRDVGAESATRRWGGRLALGVALWLVYVANGREVGAGDTIPAILQPIAIARGDGLALDRFVPVLEALDPGGAAAGRFPPYYVGRSGGRLVSRYPPAPVLVSLPLVLPQIALLDRLVPGWDATPAGTMRHGRWMAKNASAAIAAATAIVLLELLRRLGLGRVAPAATLVAALGSPLWTIAAQSPWSHGPATLALATAMLLLVGEERPATRIGAGAALGVAVASRYAAVAFAAPLLAWAVWRRPRDAAPIAVPMACVGAVAIAHNVAVFGTVLGGYPEIENVRLAIQGLDVHWGPLGPGIAGTLFSPSRGLFVFCPWVLAALLVSPAIGRRLLAAPLVPALLVGLAAHLAVVAGYSAWWAGWCFGPRYWTEAVPALATLYAFALDWARERRRLIVAVLYATGLGAVALHAFGAACYPSSWNAVPGSVGVRRERLWDWRDSELGRELREGPRPRDFPLVPW